MRKLKSSIYLNSPDSYIALDNGNVVIKEGKEIIGRIPLINIEDIYSFGYRGASPSLIGECMEKGIPLIYLRPSGKFLGRVVGSTKGNVYLRVKQYEAFSNDDFSLEISKNMITGKIYNSRNNLLRVCRDHPYSVDSEKLKQIADELKGCLKKIQEAGSPDSLRAIEGEAARKYFSTFNDLILDSSEISFHGRTKHPPLDEVNAMLSFAYTLLTSLITSACEGVGLDPFVGCFHVERPGRVSLSLDLIEELRPVMADRFVLSLLNRKIITKSDFERRENGMVQLSDKGRKVFLKEWQNRKNEIIKHPYFEEKVEWGLIPFTQAKLLAKFLFGEIDSYPPFLWK
ncbi:type I-C CRISPR-associated endonuclease Cas1c [Ileibacterium valens]|uniref:type I-C CRISPR-associated endonuclease Cas1c n=1 Tax=Ileibacterium valens TaxID=1862668 RepID=UPI00259B9859|nr:type I-C CRISPR-associated endonuclease Cas1c [Ileibacterium valens]